MCSSTGKQMEAATSARSTCRGSYWRKSEPSYLFHYHSTLVAVLTSIQGWIQCCNNLTFPCRPSTPAAAPANPPCNTCSGGCCCQLAPPPAAAAPAFPGLHLLPSISSVVNSSHSSERLKWGPPSCLFASARASGKAPCCSRRLRSAGSTGCDSGTGRKQGRDRLLLALADAAEGSEPWEASGWCLEVMLLRGARGELPCT